MFTVCRIFKEVSFTHPLIYYLSHYKALERKYVFLFIFYSKNILTLPQMLSSWISELLLCYTFILFCCLSVFHSCLFFFVWLPWFYPLFCLFVCLALSLFVNNFAPMGSLSLMCINISMYIAGVKMHPKLPHTRIYLYERSFSFHMYVLHSAIQ